MRIKYLVAGCNAVRRDWYSEWFAAPNPAMRGFSTYVTAKTYPHALRQYRKVPTKYRQIDAYIAYSPIINQRYVKKYHGYET